MAMKAFTRILLILSAAAVYGTWFIGNDMASKNEEGYFQEEGGDIADVPPKLKTESSTTEPDLDSTSDLLPNPSAQTEPHKEHARIKRSYQDEDEELRLEEEHEKSGVELLVTSGRYKYSLNATEYLADDSATTLTDVPRELDQYLKTCARCMVQWEAREQCPLHTLAPELLTWMGDLKELLSLGCQVPYVPNVHRCCIANDMKVSQILRDIAVMIRDVYKVMQDSCSRCPRDGNWSEWGEWSTCSVECGQGTRWRTRTCSNPKPEYGGQNCLGRGREESTCSNPSCCVDGGWSSWTYWSQCSVSCGNGYRNRLRTCSNPSPNHCGSQCPGSKQESEICREKQCCVSRNGNWSPWMEWSSCSVTCGCGIKERSRLCNNPPNNECGNDCVGNSLDKDICIGPDCCVDGQWGPWGPYSRCSVTCGIGVQTRVRACDNPSPDHCGRPCPNPTDDTEITDCEIPCPTPEPPIWHEWEEWCPCDCRKGVRSRIRACVRNSMISGVADVDSNLCFGNSREEIYCDVTLTSCPKCITACDRNVNGIYQSCANCRHYITCTRGKMTMGTCNQPNEFDAFKRKCVPGPSPSCALAECVQDCRTQEDGNYPSCEQCDAYVLCRQGRMTKILCDDGTEFDKHFGRCRTDNRPSPTCIRRSSIDNFNFNTHFADDPDSAAVDSDNNSGKGESVKVKNHDIPLVKGTMTNHSKVHTSDIIKGRNVDTLHQTTDKAATGKGDNSDKAQRQDHRRRHQHNKKMGMTKKVPENRTNKSLLKVKCYWTCSGPGFFQSCRGCQYYVMCTKHGVAHVRKCPDDENWDDVSKTCKLKSSTCSGRAQLIPANGSSRDPFTKDMS